MDSQGYIHHSFWGDIQYERRMGLDFIISYSENNMLFILLVKTHHFGWLKPIILATASPSPPWATRWQHGHQGYGPGPLLSFFFGFRTLRTTSCIYIYIYQICACIYIYICFYVYTIYTFFRTQNDYAVVWLSQWRSTLDFTFFGDLGHQHSEDPCH